MLYDIPAHTGALLENTVNYAHAEMPWPSSPRAFPLQNTSQMPLIFRADRASHPHQQHHQHRAGLLSTAVAGSRSSSPRQSRSAASEQTAWTCSVADTPPQFSPFTESDSGKAPPDFQKQPPKAGPCRHVPALLYSTRCRAGSSPLCCR